MDRLIHYGAYAANALLLVAVCYFITEAYGNDVFLVALLAIPPVLSIKALRSGPDLEERRLTKALNKAKLRKELAGFGEELPVKGCKAAGKSDKGTKS